MTLGLISPDLRRRIMQAAEGVVNPPRDPRFWLEGHAEEDPLLGIELRFLARTATHLRYGYAHVVSAHALVESSADVLTMLEDEAVRKIRRGVEGAGDTLRLIETPEAHLLSMRGKRIPI